MVAVCQLDGQLTIFDYIKTLSGEKEKEKFSWDDDINDIYENIVKLTEKFNIPIKNAEWSIWGHVPQYGYRMSLTIELCKERQNEIIEFLTQLNEIVEYADKREIELSPMQPVFIGSDRNGWMHIFSTFNDKKRRNRKE